MTGCWYRDCTIKRAMLSDKHVFFNIPKEEPRRTLWIERCGHRSSDATPTTRRQICEQHFMDRDIRRQFYRSTLRKGALPIPWAGACDNDGAVEEDEAQSIYLEHHQKETEEERTMYVEETSESNTLVLDVNADVGANTLTADPLIADEDHYDYEHLDSTESMNEEMDIIEDLRLDLDVANEDDHKDDWMRFEVLQASQDELVEVCAADDDDDNGAPDDEYVTRCDSTSELKDPAETIDALSAASSIAQAPEQALIIAETVAYSCERALQRRALKRKIQMHAHSKLSQPKRSNHRNGKPKLSVRTASTATEITASTVPMDPVQIRMTQEFPEDTYFALSLVGSLQRLQPQQRAMAKMNIVRYLTEMAFTESATL